MCSATMTDLRALRPLDARPAVLPDHDLRFNVPGIRGVEPSYASVEPAEGACVHGVLYDLSEEDFSRVCLTEAVPFAYRVHRCRCRPYVSREESNAEDGTIGVTKYGDGVAAYTLRAANRALRAQPASRDVPPSQQYLNVLLRGASEFQLDERYVEKLLGQRTSSTLLGGISESMLDMAILRKQLLPAN
ncbi:hypothetical protein ACHAWF_009684 [Thalassiosira exigua]